MNLDALGLGGLAISDFTAWVGWLAIIMLTLNFALGILQPLRYDTTTRWPHRRLPASLFKLHKWIGYSAIAVVVAHPLFLLWHPKTPFSLTAIYIPFTAPAETLLAGIGTLAFYMLLVVTVTSFLRLSFGLKLWKQIHYVAYALLPTALMHGLLVNSSLDGAVQIDYIDAGKLIVETCAAVTIALIIWRLAYHRRSREMDSPQQATTGEGEIVATVADHLPWTGQLTLLEVFQETWNVKTLRFAAEATTPLPFTFVAGQYLQIAGIRNYTISSAPEERNYVEVTIKQEAGGFFFAAYA